MYLLKLLKQKKQSPSEETEIEAELRQYFPNEKIVVLTPLVSNLVAEMLWNSKEKCYIFEAPDFYLKTPVGAQYSEKKYTTTVVRSQRKSRPNR